jgi:hypothetical protein
MIWYDWIRVRQGIPQRSRLESCSFPFI